MKRLVMLAVLAAGCAPLAMPDAPEGAKLYTENCAMCHGVSGRGDGELARGMHPAPSDLTRLSQGGVFPVSAVLSQIDGYTRMAARPDMPEFGVLLRGDTVPVTLEDGSQSPVARPLAALMTYLESIQR